MTKSKVLVIGAGFAGLVSALRLYSYGIDFEIFDSLDCPTTIGGGLTVFPNAMKVLRDIGVADQVIESGVTMERIKFQSKNGDHLIYRSMGTKDLYEEPSVTIRRSELMRILLEKVSELGLKVSFGKKLLSIEDTEDVVKATFEDGSTICGACVIGADGIGSKVREYVLEKEFSPLYSKLVYAAGFISDKDLAKKLNLDKNTQYVTIGSTNFFGYNYIDNPEKDNPCLFWNTFLNQSERLASSQLNSMSDDDILKWVLKEHQGSHYPIKEMVNSTQSISKASLSEVVEIDKWCRGNVVVIGDAAHSMNPISGQGACTAMEDAYILVELIRKFGDDFSFAFSELERIRKPRVSKIAKKSRRSSHLSTVRLHPLIEKIRNYLFAILTFLTPEKRANWIIAYDVRKVVKS